MPTETDFLEGMQQEYKRMNRDSMEDGVTSPVNVRVW
jgi:hypothetical protein